MLCVATASAALADAEDAEALVRPVYYEGVPAAAAEALDASGVARLGEMLGDPAESAHHGNIVDALGLSGRADAFPILRDWAGTEPVGEIGRDAFRARSRLPAAIGRLARSDRRALDWLLAAVASEPEPAWSFRQLQGGALRTLLFEQTLTGLALSGAPEAGAAIDAALAALASGSGPVADRRRRHAEHARALHLRRAAEVAP